MMKRDIDVIVVRGEFTREEETKDIIVQEHTGNMLWLQDASLLNIQKDGEPFNLTDYVENYINDENHKNISHLVFNYVSLPNVIDTINPLKIVETWNKHHEGTITMNSFVGRSITLNLVNTDDIRKKINSLRGIYDKMYGYMEIYVYYKEN